jgi:protoporphyrinogen oxidase
MDNGKKKRIDIIGAGISGLASAYFLAESSTGLEIHLWERDSALGGLAGSFSTEYFTVEKFYHHLYRRDIALTALIEQLGLGNDLKWRAASTGAYYQQLPYRLSSPLDLLRYKPLDFLDRLRLGWLMMHVRRCKDWRQLDDIPVREYVTNIAGEAVYNIVWEPLFRGKFGQYADSISAAWLWSKLVDRGGSRNIGGQEVLGYLRGGLGRVFDEMVRRIRNRGHSVHMGCGVRKLVGN